MKLSDLFPDMKLGNAGDLNAVGITADSRKVTPGFIFAALKGSAADGRAYICKAIDAGAIAILTDLDFEGAVSVPLLKREEPRRDLAFALKAFCGEMPPFMAAVTGTNGKTSVAHFLRQIWSRAGFAAASVGTLGIMTDDALRPLHHTTPDPEILYSELAALTAQGVNHVVIEASSHGLDQRRLDALDIRVGGFTNLTRDHLDYHKDFASYLQAKLGLVDRALSDGGTIVVNADSDVAETFTSHAKARGLTVLTYGEAGEDFKILDAHPHSGGQVLTFRHQGQNYEIDLPLIGTFQGANILCALGMAVASGVAIEAALASLADVQNVPGRMEWAGRSVAGADIYVDFAHTPDALETVLKAARPHTKGRLITVFGCGGDRDAGKRPQMGAIAADFADVAIVTDDNPRSEDPGAIRGQVLAACSGGIDGGDRRNAMVRAIHLAGEGDLVLIAGKGHESGQTIGAETFPFNDREVALEILRGDVA